MTKRPSDRVLRRWLRTGRPRRVERRLDDDPAVQQRLETLTALDGRAVAAIDVVTTPLPGFRDRTATKVRERAADDDFFDVVLDLLGLGFHVGQAMARPDESDRHEE